MKVVRLSALRTGRLYPQEIFLVLRLSQLQGHSGARKIISIKNFNDTIGNRTRDLPAVVQCLNQLHYRVPLLYV
jgi:hypothetical protein